MGKLASAKMSPTLSIPMPAFHTNGKSGKMHWPILIFWEGKQKVFLGWAGMEWEVGLDSPICWIPICFPGLLIFTQFRATSRYSSVTRGPIGAAAALPSTRERGKVFPSLCWHGGFDRMINKYVSCANKYFIPPMHLVYGSFFFCYHTCLECIHAERTEFSLEQLYVK